MKAQQKINHAKCSAQTALVQEPYFRKKNLYLGNLVYPDFATFSNREMGHD